MTTSLSPLCDDPTESETHIAGRMRYQGKILLIVPISNGNFAVFLRNFDNLKGIFPWEELSPTLLRQWVAEPEIDDPAFARARPIVRIERKAGVPSTQNLGVELDLDDI